MHRYFGRRYSVRCWYRCTALLTVQFYPERPLDKACHSQTYLESVVIGRCLSLFLLSFLFFASELLLQRVNHQLQVPQLTSHITQFPVQGGLQIYRRQYH